MIDFSKAVSKEKLLEEEKFSALSSADNDIDNIYTKAVGARLSEYITAEKEAQEFKTSGYLAESAPSSVVSWAEIKGQNLQWAADSILSTAFQWRKVQAVLRTNRLSYKEKVRLAKTVEEVTELRKQWQIFIQAMTTS